MKEFIAWVVAPANINANIFTFLTVILSGIISWVISRRFYTKSNRDGLTSSILQPMKQLLNGPCTREKFRELEALSRGYSSRFLKDEEHEVIRSLLFAYKEVYYYDDDYMRAECLFSYFKHKLRCNGISPEIEPVEIDGEYVDTIIPPELHSRMLDDLCSAIKNYPPDFEAERCTQAAISCFNYYCEQYYADRKIVFFNDHSLENVLENSVIKKDWDKKFEELQDAKENFNNLKLLKKKRTFQQIIKEWYNKLSTATNGNQ